MTTHDDLAGGAPHLSHASPPRAPRCSNFVKAFEYVNRVKQFRTKEVMARVRTCARPAISHLAA